MIAITNYSHGVCPHGRTPYRGISAADQPAINLSTFFHLSSTRSTCSSAAVALAKVATRLKPFSAFSPSRRVHNHYSKRILNLILNRKKFLRRRNETLGNLIRGKTAAANPARYTFSINFVLVRRSSLERRRKLCAEALHHPFSNMSSQPCIFHCPSKQRTSNRSPDSIMRP